MTKIHIAGIEGFIGSHLKEYVLETTDWQSVSMDGSPDYIVHLAGHSQIDESIGKSDCVRRDISTTIDLLNWATDLSNLKKFLYFSSDEVFGPKEVIEDFRPNDRYNPYSPYAAGKAACEGLCMAWARTYNVPTIITHCQNLFGERQPANKFLPTVVRCALKGEPVPIYADGTSAWRNFLHVRDACSAIVLLLEKGKVRDKYNIASRFEISSSGFVEEVAKIMGLQIKIELRPASGVRRGFFLCHGLNGDKLQELGWRRWTLKNSLSKTVPWMVKEENRHWLGL